MKLFPYQETGAEFLATHRTALLADQPGLGKTAQAIIAAKRVFPGFTPLKACVIAPKTALTNWSREWARWWPTGPKPTIINYDLLSIPSQTRLDFIQTDWDLIICDEAHRLKSPGAKRTQTVYRTVARQKKPPRVWLLTGTPSRNHAGELWTHLRTLRPDLIHDRGGKPMSQGQFEDLYCNVHIDGFGHRAIRGSKNTGELRKILIDGGFMLRRMKKDVQAELPDLIFDTYPLDVVLPKTLEKDFQDLGIVPGMDPDEALVILKRNVPHMSTARRLTGLLKVEAVGDLVLDELEAPGKAIVFFHHTEVGDHLRDRLVEMNPVMVDGRTKNAQAEVDTFQNDPDCRVFLGQITACGEALNITAADRVFFAEASWSPADNYQAACRAHRIGMGVNLTVKFLCAAGSIDETINRVLARKMTELAELFD